MAVYWPSVLFFFGIFMDGAEVKVHINANKKSKTNIQPS